MLIRSLVEVASRGGNFLLNVGPQPDGVIQPEFQERLPTIGSWLSVNGESIYGTRLQTVARRSIDSDDGEEGQNLRSRVGLQERVLSAYLVPADNPLKMQKSEGELRIELTS